MFSRWFPGPWVSQTWADHFNTHQPSGGLSWMHMVGLRFQQLVHETPILWLWALLPLLLLRKKSREALKGWWDWIALFFLAYVLMVVAVMHDAELRYLGASLWVAAVLGVVFWLLFLEEFLPKRRFAGELVLFLALLGVSKLPTHFLWKFFRISPGEAFVLTHTAGEAKAWLRAHADGRLVLLYGDNETYYLSTLRAAVVTERPDIDRATYKKTDLAEFLRGLCETSGASFLLDSRPGIGLQARFPSGPWNEAVLFERAGARVYDLNRLQGLVLKGDYGCGRT
jgi:hypothetical protein